jgi:hypothetical protein
MLFPRDITADTGSSLRLFLVGAGQNCRVRDKFRDKVPRCCRRSMQRRIAPAPAAACGLSRQMANLPAPRMASRLPTSVVSTSSSKDSYSMALRALSRRGHREAVPTRGDHFVADPIARDEVRVRKEQSPASSPTTRSVRTRVLSRTARGGVLEKDLHQVADREDANRAITFNHG